MNVGAACDPPEKNQHNPCNIARLPYNGNIFMPQDLSMTPLNRLQGTLRRLFRLGEPADLDFGIHRVISLKRGLYGIYRHVSRKRLGRYIDEFSFRLNEGGVDILLMARIASLCAKTGSKHLPYSKLVGRAS